jgi:iron(III) transport system ATP-binding protein
MVAVALKNVEKSFDGKMACSNINLTIEAGEFFTFLGPSGCGKTTILRLIAGFIKPDKGSIHLGDKDITHLEPEKRNVGMVFQNYALFPFLSVYDNIAYGLKIRKKPAREIKQTVQDVIEMIGLSGFEKRGISELSGGEQQRVALARSLVTEPSVLLLDEPLSNLDARLRDKMRLEIKSLQKKLGITTIFVTHDQTEALTMSDTIAVFDQGCIAQVGTPKDLYANPDSAFVAKFIGDTNLFDAAFADEKAIVSGTLVFHLDRFRRQGKFISIRPQDITLSITDPGCSNTFRARLEETQFNGIWIDHIVKVGDFRFRVSALNRTGNYLSYQPGDDVFISFPQNSINVLDR